jgi:hypothetical protein
VILQNGFTFFLDIRELFISLMGMTYTLVNVHFSIVDHLYYGREAPFEQDEKNNNEDERHPKKQTAIRN